MIGERSRYLDVLRGIAILGVITIHVGSTVNGMLWAHSASLPGWLTQLTDFGKFGVQLFFLISGWLLQNLYGNAANELNLKQFFARRLARIYPLWLLFLGAGFALPLLGIDTGIGQLLGQVNGQTRVSGAILILVAGLSFTLWLYAPLWNTVVPGGWSIQAEVGHYLLFPWLRRLSNAALIWFVAAVRLLSGAFGFAGGILAPIGPFRDMAAAWIRLGLYNSVLFFVAGMLVSRWLASRRRPRWREASALASVALTVPLCPDGAWQIFLQLTFIALALWLGWAVVRSDPWSALLARLGKYSYFMYFFHFLLLPLSQKLGERSGIAAWASGSLVLSVFLVPLVIVLVTCCSLAAGAASWRFLESPIIRFSRRV